MDFKTFVFSVSFKYLFSLVLLSSRLYCRLWNLLCLSESPDQRFHARGLYRRSGLSVSNYIRFRSPCPEDLFAFSAHMIAQTFCKCNLFLRASRFELQSQTLLLQPTHPRHPHGTQEILLRAAPFLT